MVDYNREDGRLDRFCSVLNKGHKSGEERRGTPALGIFTSPPTFVKASSSGQRDHNKRGTVPTNAVGVTVIDVSICSYSADYCVTLFNAVRPYNCMPILAPDFRKRANVRNLTKSHVFTYIVQVLDSLAFMKERF